VSKVYRQIVWNEIGRYLVFDEDKLGHELMPNLLYYVASAKFLFFTIDFHGDAKMITYATINENGDYIEYTTEDDDKTDRLIHELEVQGYSYYEILESLRI